MTQTLLVRYGLIPEVARFAANGDRPYQRGERVVVQSHRGEEIGTVLESVRSTNGADKNDSESNAYSVLRSVTPDDELRQQSMQQECRQDFEKWRGHIDGWDLELELIDLEWLLDRGKLILYVLNDRGADCTKLAIYAAAEGLAPVEVQPVDASGLVQMPSPTGGCGSGGCGSGGCGTEH